MHQDSLRLKNVQWIIWIVLFIIHVASLLPYDPPLQAVAYSLINVGFYAVIIYGNASLLLPSLYAKNKKITYFIAALFFIAAAGFLRYFVNMEVYNRFFAEKPSPFRWASIISSLISTTLVFVSSVLFYIAMNFFRLKQREQDLQKRHAQMELDLLKAQVQPHFLFNTLNNIYFVAQRESPATAALLDQLSQIMRYFVDEAPKDKILLSAELHFIKSYIDLEKMRMRYPLRVTISEKNIGEEYMVPPMLLIPLVENVFKHGVDKRRDDNFVDITISVTGNRLKAVVANLTVHYEPEVKSGVGLKNLRSRLELLYSGDYTLQAGESGAIYEAEINIPL